MSKLLPVLIIAIASILLIPFPVFAPSHPEYVGFEKPLKQMAQGIEPENVMCNKELVLMIKLNRKAACMQNDTAIILEQRGWGMISLICCNNMHTQAIVEPIQTSKIMSQECSGNARCITGTVTQVIDGDTIKVDGQSIRFALASAPELNEFEGDESRELINTLCPVGSTATVDEDDEQTQGIYGIIVGVINCNGVNLNEELVDSGFGYLATGFCDSSEFSTQLWAQKHGCSGSESQVTVQQIQNCDPSYPDFCIPSSLPDLDCGDIPQKRFTVLQPDPHRFDGDKDGTGCES